MIKVRVIAIFFVFICTVLPAQSNQQIVDKNKELEELKAEVDRLERVLEDARNSENQSVDMLEKISEQNLYLNKVINNLEKSERELEQSLIALIDSLANVESNITNLRKIYADYVKWLYIYKQNSFVDLLFSSGSINQVVIRYKYLNYITDKNEEVLDNLILNKQKYEELKRKIEYDIAEKEKVIVEKEQEQSLLNERKTEKEKLIEDLRLNQRNLEKEIDEKRKAEVVIKEMIANLIEEERERERKIREDRLRGVNNAAIPRYNYDSFETFTDLKGSLNWPVKNGEIIRDFGENENEKLKTITINYGIDISTEKNTNVYAVAEGVVSAIDWIPGYGSIIIVTHKGNYRTVYGHVADIKVSEGDIVHGGLLLGTVSESLEGNVVHFEVWEERNYQDPHTWLLAKE